MLSSWKRWRALSPGSYFQVRSHRSTSPREKRLKSLWPLRKIWAGMSWLHRPLEHISHEGLLGSQGCRLRLAGHAQPDVRQDAIFAALQGALVVRLVEETMRYSPVRRKCEGQPPSRAASNPPKKRFRKSTSHCSAHFRYCLQGQGSNPQPHYSLHWTCVFPCVRSVLLVFKS